MSVKEKIQIIDHLKKQIEDYGPIEGQILRKINYKLRLEWNYTSNSMEGNTLTVEETRGVMMNNITVTDKPLKDVLEVKGHDKVISDILKIGKGELNISESRIREIHKGIMYEDDIVLKDKIGKWKTQENYITNYKSERYDFVAAADVAEKMHQLINWLNSEKEKIDRKAKDAISPVLVAFKFHLEYLTIHPFYDGNGRTARILTNLILIAYGFPPIYIKAKEKEAYYRYIADVQAYGGSPDLFYEFMADRLIRSMQLILDAMEGKDIEEEEDVLKDLELLKKRVLSEEVVTKSPALVYKHYLEAEKNLIPALKESLNRFNDFFSDAKEVHFVNQINEEYNKTTKSIFNTFTYETSSEPPKKKIFGHDIYEMDIDSIRWQITKYGLKNAIKQTDLTVNIELLFGIDKYTIAISKITDVVRSYSESIDENVATGLKHQLTRSFLEQIKNALKAN